MNYPEDVTQEEWRKIKSKNPLLTVEEWDDKPTQIKNVMLKFAGVVRKYDKPNFGEDFNIIYPDDIYFINSNKTKVILNRDDIKNILPLLKNINEYGNTISYSLHDNEIIKTIGKFIEGTPYEVKRDYGYNIQTEFHTHPIKSHTPIDPPSSLDITSYMDLIMTYVAGLVLNLETNELVLPVENEMVFSDGVYVYYISQPLISKMYDDLEYMYNGVNNETSAFIEKFKSYSDKVIANYRDYISRMKPTFIGDMDTLNKYMNDIMKLGIIMKRFDYDSIESYVTLR